MHRRREPEHHLLVVGANMPFAVLLLLESLFGPTLNNVIWGE